MTAATPWAGLAGPIPLPQWAGPARVHRLVDDCEDPPPPAPGDRICTRCGRAFPPTPEHFYRGSGPGGLRYECKGCYRAHPSVQRKPRPPAPRTRCAPWALLHPGTEQERELLARVDAPWPLLDGR